MRQLVMRIYLQFAWLLNTAIFFGCASVSWQAFAENVVAEVPDQYYYAVGRLCDRVEKPKSLLEEIIDHIGPVSSSLEPYPHPDHPLIKKDENFWRVPDFADHSVLFLNGFHVQYLNKDHHVRSVGARLAVEDMPAEGVIRWWGGAQLLDKGWDDSVQGCVYYTKLAWNSDHFKVEVLPAFEGWDNGGEPIAVVRDDRVIADGDGVLLPTAYMVIDPNGDRHLYQLAVMGDNGGGPVAGRGRLRSIFKDNDEDSKNDFFGGGRVMIGSGALVQRTDFEFTAKSPACKPSIVSFGGCIGESQAPAFKETQSRTVVVDDVKATLFFPVLTGFELVSRSNDDHVRSIGYWLDEISFDPEARRLKFDVSAMLLDKNNSPFYHQDAISIVGLVRSGPGGTEPATLPDKIKEIKVR